MRPLRLALLCGAMLAGLAPARAAETETIRCVNPYSGTRWTLRVDYRRGTVDSYPASIDRTTIAWHDLGVNGHYTLDRRSGALTVIFASSTGGYLLHDTCRAGR
ncbi:MAG: hypothetical protein KGI51_08210 [Rhodospirillales bacterium]|nr:hypothetical protein [Rhodospirillales bacterium]